MYQLLCFGANNAAGAALVDTPSIPDENFNPQNGHWIFYEDYSLAAVAAVGASITQVQLFDSTWNSINVQQVYPTNLSATIPNNPNVKILTQYPVQIPQNEQVSAQISNNLAMGTEYEFVLMWLLPGGKVMSQPNPPAPFGNAGRVQALFTVTTALTAGIFSGDTPIAVPNVLRGGTYCVAGLQLVVPNGIAYRVNFPRAPLYQGRKLNPGNLVQNAYGDVPQKEGTFWLGPMGYFDTSEFFQIAILGNQAVGSATYTGFLDLIYMGPNLIGQGGMNPGQM